MPWNNSSRPLLSLSNASYSRTFHPQHPPDLHPRYPLQIYCSLMVDSHGDNVETINLCISHQQFITEKTENVWVKENTPHMTFHEMTHKDRVLIYRIMLTLYSRSYHTNFSSRGLEILHSFWVREKIAENSAHPRKSKRLKCQMSLWNFKKTHKDVYYWYHSYLVFFAKESNNPEFNRS